jgi:hypothetical protein
MNHKSDIKSTDALNPAIAIYLWESGYFFKSTKDLAGCLCWTAKFHLSVLPQKNFGPILRADDDNRYILDNGVETSVQVPPVLRE